MQPATSDLFSLVQPEIVVVIERREGLEFDEQASREDLYRKITAEIKASRNTDAVPPDYREVYRSHYDRVHVIGVNTAEKTKKRSGVKDLSERLTALKQASMKRRHAKGVFFNLEQLSSLMKSMLRHFCDSKECPPLQFQFAQQSRAARFPGTQNTTVSTKDIEQEGYIGSLDRHLKEVLVIIPVSLEDEPLLPWLSEFICPLVTSAILLACYPPGAPCKFTSTTFSHDNNLL